MAVDTYGQTIITIKANSTGRHVISFKNEEYVCNTKEIPDIIKSILVRERLLR
jgi:hypothetical protein